MGQLTLYVDLTKSDSQNSIRELWIITFIRTIKLLCVPYSRLFYVPKNPNDKNIRTYRATTIPIFVNKEQQDPIEDDQEKELIEILIKKQEQDKVEVDLDKKQVQIAIKREVQILITIKKHEQDEVEVNQVNELIQITIKKHEQIKVDQEKELTLISIKKQAQHKVELNEETEPAQITIKKQELKEGKVDQEKELTLISIKKQAQHKVELNEETELAQITIKNQKPTESDVDPKQNHVLVKKNENSDELDKSDEVRKQLYDNIITSWHQLISVRFQLLAFIPLVSLTVWLLLAQNFKLYDPYFSAFVALLSIIALHILTGIRIYDLRNTQLHDDLISRGRRMEEEWRIDTGVFRGRLKSFFTLKTGDKLQHDTGMGLMYDTVMNVWRILFFLSLLNGIIGCFR